MLTSNVAERFVALDQKHSVDEYNFNHFLPKHLIEDVQATLTKRGIQPGEMAPDFELPRVGGGSLRLSALRDRPMLLHFGSVT